jgi:hypothetical protein
MIFFILIYQCCLKNVVIVQFTASYRPFHYNTFIFKILYRETTYYLEKAYLATGQLETSQLEESRA